MKLLISNFCKANRILTLQKINHYYVLSGELNAFLYLSIESINI